MAKKTQLITLIVVLGVVLGALLWEPVLKGLWVEKPLIENIIVGTDATYPPMEYLDDKGNFVGLDIDIAKAIASDLGAEIEFRNIGWDELITFDALLAGEVNMLISSMTVTTERAQTVDFSDPYFNAGQVVVTTTDQAAEIRGAADLEGRKVGVQGETTSEEEAQKYTDQVEAFADYDLAKSALLAGTIEAIIIDYPAAVGMVSGEATLKIIGEPFTQEFYGIAVKKGETALLNGINQTVRRLKREGKLKELELKWLLPSGE